MLLIMDFASTGFDMEKPSIFYYFRSGPTNSVKNRCDEFALQIHRPNDIIYRTE